MPAGWVDDMGRWGQRLVALCLSLSLVFVNQDEHLVEPSVQHGTLREGYLTMAHLGSPGGVRLLSGSHGESHARLFRSINLWAHSIPKWTTKKYTHVCVWWWEWNG